jgi:hypothetical protein
MEIVEFDHMTTGRRDELEGDEDDPFDAAGAALIFLGPDFMILFCHANRRGLYSRLGFEEVERPVLVQQPEAYVEMPMRTMWRALARNASWPNGRLTVHGLPF